MRITSERRLAKIRIIGASDERPVMLCKTCGLATDKVVVRHGDSLRHIPDHTPHRYKTWKRTVKYSDTHKSSYHHIECRAKEIFFSYLMMDCIARKHRISVRRSPFSSSLVSELR